MNEPTGRATFEAITGEGPDKGRGDVGNLVEAFVDCGKQVFDRTSERVKQNLELARERKYGINAWLDDVEWFWKGVADDAAKFAEALRRPEAEAES